MSELIVAASAFIGAGMALGLLVYRDSRPRRDEWQTIVRRSDRPTPTDHSRRYCDRREHDHERS